MAPATAPDVKEQATTCSEIISAHAADATNLDDASTAMEKASVGFLIIAAYFAREIKNVVIVAATGAAVPKIIHRVPPAESAPCA